MPSINTMITGFALTALSLVQICSAAPALAPTPAKAPPVKAVTPTLPVNGGASELPAPSTAFVSVAIGRGVQNYSCSAVGAAPVTIGAIATLFDATALASTDPAAFNALTSAAVMTPPGKNNCFVLPPNAKLAKTGNHFFAADGTPNFVLNSGKSIMAKKNAFISAPSSAAKGPSGSAAVDWLQLISKPAPFVSVGLSAVYRVETAGGTQSPTCTAVGTQSVQYAAQYFFYS